MYYLTANIQQHPHPAPDLTEISLSANEDDENHDAVSQETVFSAADLWNLQRNQKTIHVTDRLPRTWEASW
jgi:hypothetical protein